MPTPHHIRKSTNERLAREKALHTHVYISGLAGHHTLQTGLAYYYRGHYIYAYPAGNLIEPVPYSTRKGITIQGIVSKSAPAYDAKASGLVEEASVRALAASVDAERRRLEAVKVVVGECGSEVCGGGDGDGDEDEIEDKAVEPTGQDGGGHQHITPPTTVTATATATVIPTAVFAPRPLPLISTPSAPPPPTRTTTTTTYTPPPPPPPRALTPSHSHSHTHPLHLFTPQPGLSFLAASAPTSRLGSRAASPATGLRPTSSHVGLARLQGGLLSGLSRVVSLQGRGEGGEYEKGNARHVLGFSGAGGGGGGDSRRCWDGMVGYLPGLGDHALDAGAVDVCVGGGVGVGVVAAEMEITVGGVGSVGALGKGGCGGLGDGVPILRAGGREMVDWVGLLEDIKGKGEGVGV